MTQSRNAVSNLIARYKAVLKNCHLLNAMATAVLAGSVVLGGASAALAADTVVNDSMYSINGDIATLNIDTAGNYVSGVDLSDTFGNDDIPLIFGASVNGSTNASNVVMNLTNGTYSGIIFSAGFVEDAGNALNLNSTKANVAATATFEDESEISGGVFTFNGASSSIDNTTVTYLTTPELLGDWYGITGASQALGVKSGTDSAIITTTVKVGTANVIVGGESEPIANKGAVSIDGGGCAIAEIFDDATTSLSNVKATTNTTTTNITINKSATVASIVGGDRAELEGDTSKTYSNITLLAETGTTNITINDGQLYEEVLAGGIASYEVESEDPTSTAVSSGSSDITISSTVDTTNLTIKGGDFNTYSKSYTDSNGDEQQGTQPLFIFGGSGAQGEFSSASVKETNITISGGTFDELTYVHTGGYANEGATSTVETANLTITGGNFTNAWIQSGRSESGGITEVGTSNITISGGEFNGSYIYAGGVATLGSESTVETANLTISGGTFTGDARIYANGSAYSDNDTSTVKEANITIAGGTFNEGYTTISACSDPLSNGNNIVSKANITFTGKAGNQNNIAETASLADGYSGIGIDGAGAESTLAFVGYTGEFKAGVTNIETMNVDGTSNVYVDGGSSSLPNVAFADVTDANDFHANMGDFNVLNIAEGGTLRIGDEDAFTGALSVTDTVVTLTSADIKGDVLFTETADARDVATSLTVASGDVFIDGAFTNNGAAITVGDGAGVVNPDDTDDDFDDYDSVLVVDSFTNTGSVTINSDAKIVVKNGLTVDADDNYVLDGGEAIILGSGLDLTAVTTAGNATFALGNDDFSLGDEHSKITTTTVTLADGVEDIVFNGGRVLILGDDKGGEFINNTGNLAINSSAWLCLGSEFTSAGVQKYTPEYASYNPGGTYKGKIAIAEHAGLDVDAGNWTVGNVSSEGYVSLGGYGVEASLTTGAFTTSGEVVITADATLDASAGFTAMSGTVTIAEAGTLIIDDGAVGYDGLTYTETATIAADTVTNDGLVQVVFGGENIAYGDDYIAITDNVKNSLGDTTFEFVDLNINTSNTSLDDVAENNDKTLGSCSVAAGSVEAGQLAIVAGVTGADETTNEGTLTLTGKTDKEGGEGTLAEGEITNSGKMTLGSEGITAKTDKKITNTAGATTTTKGTTNLAEVENHGDLKVEGTTSVTTLTSKEGASLSVGNDTTKGSLVINKTTLNGASMFLDPAWIDGVAIEGASNASLGFADATVDGYIVVGQNSYAVLGSGSAADLTEAEAAFEEHGLTWGNAEGNITAALFLNEAYEVDTTKGGLTVDGSLTAAPSTNTAGSATFAKGSLLAIDADSLASGTAALAAKTITASEGASLLIISKGLTYDAEGDATVTIAKATGEGESLLLTSGAWGYDSSATTGMDEETIFVNNRLMEVESVALADNTYTVTVSKLEEDEASDALPGMDKDLAALLASGDTDANPFLANALDPTKTDATTAAASIEGATKAGHAAGIGAGLNSINIASTNNVYARLDSVAFNDQDTSNMLAMNGDGAIVPMNGKQEGLGVWFMPMYKHTKTDGFDSGSYDYGFTTDLYGATIGADYTFASALRLGLAFNVGTGESDSTGDFDNTDNDFDYFGVTGYASMAFGNLGLYADLGYTASSNDIDQDNYFGHLSAEADADLISAGIKADYKIAMDSINLTPYAGVRLNYYSIDGYNTKYLGANVIGTGSSDYTIIEFPVGLTIDTTLNAGDWAITPNAGLGVKFAAGDLDADQSISFNGLAGSATVSSEVADAVTFQGALGLGFAKDAYTIDLGYTLDLSENLESHGVNVNLRYEF